MQSANFRNYTMLMIFNKGWQAFAKKEKNYTLHIFVVCFFLLNSTISYKYLNYKCGMIKYNNFNNITSLRHRDVV